MVAGRQGCTAKNRDVGTMPITILEHQGGANSFLIGDEIVYTIPNNFTLSRTHFSRGRKFLWEATTWLRAWWERRSTPNIKED